jgi:hypothetical protein
MVDRNAMIDDPATGQGEVPADGQSLPETLEQRVHRLEDAVAALQDTKLIEERVAERVMGRMNRKRSKSSTAIVNAERLAQTPAGPGLAPGGEAHADAQAIPSLNAKRPWLIVEVCHELRTMFRMFFDPRYRVSWSAFFALMVLAYILVSKWLWSLWGAVPILGLLTEPMHLTFIGEILDKTVDLILALFAYKTLSREMRRYREAISGQSSPYEN